MESCPYLPDPIAKFFVRVQDQLVFVGGKLALVVLVENGGHRFYRLLHDLIRLKVMWRQGGERVGGFGLKAKDIDCLTGVEGMCPLQEDQFIHPETVVESLAGIIRHSFVVYLLCQAAGNAQEGSGNEVCWGTARGSDEFIDRPQLLHQLSERVRVLYAEINGMGGKAAVIVECELKAIITVANALYPADKGVFHDLSCLKRRDGDMRFIAYRHLQPIVSGELLLFVPQFLLKVAVRINDEQVFGPSFPPLYLHVGS